MEVIWSVVNPFQLQVILYLVAANLVFGVIAAIKNGQFQLSKLKDFGVRAMVYTGTYVGVSLAVMAATKDDSGALSIIPALQSTIWLAILASQLKDIGDNLKDLGFPMPNLSELVNGLSGRLSGRIPA